MSHHVGKRYGYAGESIRYVIGAVDDEKIEMTWKYLTDRMVEYSNF